MSDRQQPVANHAKQNDAILTVIGAVVLVVNGEYIAERGATLLEADLVFDKVRRRLGIIPFKFAIIHNTTVYPHFVKLSRCNLQHPHGIALDGRFHQRVQGVVGAELNLEAQLP